MSDPSERKYIAELRAQAVALAADEGMTAEFIHAELAIPRSVRTVSWWINQAHGRRPSRRAIQRRDPVRLRVVAYMVRQGLDPYYCYLEHRTVRPCAIHELRRDEDLGSLAFVCDKHATVADV